MPMQIVLTPDGLLPGAEVVATRSGYSEVDRVAMSTLNVGIETIKKAPVLLGETDILKTLQLMPGVSGGTEGTAGLYVRGGSPDQNLILLDGVPVYNISHVLGLFSVFNADAIQDVSLTKGGFPARYGGRLSSVLQVNMRDGPATGWSVEGGVGLISSRLTIGGPLGKQSRLLVSARRSYADALIKPYLAYRDRDSPLRDIFRANFYDLFVKYRYDINARNSVYFSGYTGQDVFRTGDRLERLNSSEINYSGLEWGNTVAAIRLRSQLSPKTFGNAILSYSNYGVAILGMNARTSRTNQRENSYAFSNAVSDYSVKYDFTHAATRNSQIRVGGVLTYHGYSPGELSITQMSEDASIDTTSAQGKRTAFESAIYVEHEWSPTPNFGIDYGLHFSSYHIDTTYVSLQPRLSVRYKLAPNYALKASYASMRQYVHLLTTETISLPNDAWLPSTKRIKPQDATQFGLAFVTQAVRAVDITVEGFYKTIDNTVNYRAGEDFLDIDSRRSWEDRITQGTGKVYGVEFLAQKSVGRLTGWLGYTLSRNERQFAELNRGRVFPFRYDRRHDVSTLISYALSPRVTVSGSWVFYSGHAYTLPQYRQSTGLYFQDGFLDGERELRFDPTPQAPTKNAYRLSDTHRLDLSIALTKPKKWGERTWTFGLYNSYWHKNPSFIREKRIVDPITQRVVSQLREVSLLPLIPSVGYSFKFQQQ